MRLQQSRVKVEQACNVPVVYQYAVDVCYPALGNDHDDKPYGGSCAGVRAVRLTLQRPLTSPQLYYCQELSWHGVCRRNQTVPHYLAVRYH